MVAPYARRPLSSDTKDDAELPQGQWVWWRIYMATSLVALAVALSFSY